MFCQKNKIISEAFVPPNDLKFSPSRMLNDELKGLMTGDFRKKSPPIVEIKYLNICFKMGGRVWERQTDLNLSNKFH